MTKKDIKTQSAKAKARLLQQIVRDKIIQMLKPWGILPEDVKIVKVNKSDEKVQPQKHKSI